MTTEMANENETTGGRLLARNTVLNMAGHLAPLVVAVVAIPLLIAGLGTDRFGILTLAWLVIGYFTLFDFGLSRALTQLISERLGRGDRDDLPVLIWSALALMLLLGTAGMLILLFASPVIVVRVLNIPLALQQESIAAFRWLAVSLPLVITSVGMRGVLEAYQRFDLVVVVRVPMGAFAFLGPVLVLPFSTDLSAIVAVLVLGRLASALGHLWCCLRAVPDLRRRPELAWATARPLLRFGSWMTISNVISPIMVHFDRFVIAAGLSIAAVAYYVTPYEAVTKLLIIPAALLCVIFPAFATTYVQDRQRTSELFDRTVRLLFLALFPIAAVLVLLAPEGLQLWLNAEFARESTPVLRWLAAGLLLSGIAQVPLAVVQGVGRPDLTAKLHLLEVPFYAVALWWGVRRFGIEGAAAVWTLRVLVDTAVLFVLASRVLPNGGFHLQRAAGLLVPALVVLVLISQPMGLGIKLAVLGAGILAFCAVAWRLVLTPGERRQARGVALVAQRVVVRRAA